MARSVTKPCFQRPSQGRTSGLLLSRVAFAFVLAACSNLMADTGEPLVLTFEGSVGAAVKTANREGLGREYMACDRKSPTLSKSLATPIENGFTVAAWVRLDAYANQGRRGFTSTNPAIIAKLGGETTALLRVDGKWPQFVTVEENGNARSATGFQPLPLGEWLHIAASWRDSRLALYVNGSLQAARQHRVSLEFDEIVVGGDRDRRFLGGVDEIELYPRELSAGEIRALAQNRGLATLRDFSWRPSIGSSTYKALEAEAAAIRPLIGGLSTTAEVVPWTADGALDLLVASEPAYFGHRVAIHTLIDSDDRKLPVYSGGDSVTLEGQNFKLLARTDGRFDLLAYGAGTPYGGAEIICYENLGPLGAPRFAPPKPIHVDGKSLAAALDDTPGPWTLHDFDGDGVEDLLLGAGEGMGANYWPDGVPMWNGKEFPNSGPGRGYDILGNWLGQPGVTRLYWARGRRSTSGEFEFEQTRPVYAGSGDYQVQWKFESPSLTPGVLTIKDKSYIILVGDVDKVLALPVEWVAGELRTGQAQPLLRHNAALSEMYWTNSVCAADLNRDGKDELLLSGNPGRIVVLEGDAVGEFRELGSLETNGGSLQVDTLATPARGDWDGDRNPDILCGDSSGYLTYWPGTENPVIYGAPKYLRLQSGERVHHQAGPNGSIQGPNEARWGYTQASLGDWDGDGTVDLLVNDIRGEITLYKQIAKPTQVEPRRLTYRGAPLKVAWRTRPAVLPASWGYANDQSALLYLNWDGDLALATSERAGGVDLTESQVMRYVDGSTVRLSGVRGHWGRAKLSIADWNSDGLWDVVWGHCGGVNRYIWQDDAPSDATVCWLRNVGSNTDPVFERLELITLADGEPLEFGVHNSSVWPTDLNRDGRLDLLVGAEDGRIYYFFREELRSSADRN